MSWKCGSISLGTPIIIKKGSIKAIVVVKEGVFFPAIMIKKREHTIGYNQLESALLYLIINVEMMRFSSH